MPIPDFSMEHREMQKNWLTHGNELDFSMELSKKNIITMPQVSF
jgi:hypothetical protein